MPELGILLTPAEENALVSHCLSLGAVLIPDIEYHSDRYVEVANNKMFCHYRDITRLFYVVHGSYIVRPLEMRMLHKDGRDTWYIVQRNGGPSIDLFLTASSSENSGKRVIPGFVAYHKTFWNADASENQEPPLSLIRFYSEIKSAIQAKAIRRVIGKRAFWVGREMVSLLNSGSAILGLSGVNWIAQAIDT